MAHLRAPHGHTTFNMAWHWNRGATTRCLLDASNPYVHAELCAGRLGNPRAGALATSTEGGHTAGRVVVRNMDIPDSYLFELD
jgi:hypothetical protein